MVPSTAYGLMNLFSHMSNKFIITDNIVLFVKMNDIEDKIPGRVPEVTFT